MATSDCSSLSPQLTVQQRRALPWPPQLQLSLEDAFFAAHALSCLRVVSEARDELSLEVMSSRCYAHCVLWHFCSINLRACLPRLRHIGNDDVTAPVIGHRPAISVEGESLVSTDVSSSAGILEALHSRAAGVCAPVRHLPALPQQGPPLPKASCP